MFSLSKDFNCVELQSVFLQVKKMKKEKGNRFKLLGPEKAKIEVDNKKLKFTIIFAHDVLFCIFSRPLI